MATYKRLKFGLVPNDLNPNHISTTEQILISYLKSAFSPDVLMDEEATIEIFKLSKPYIGDSFKSWLVANYGGGSGARAALCRAIVNWVDGKISPKAVTSEIRRDLNRIDFLKSVQEQVQIPIVYNASEVPQTEELSFESIEDRHYFEFLALLGPELLANFLLSLNGIRFV